MANLTQYRDESGSMSQDPPPPSLEATVRAVLATPGASFQPGADGGAVKVSVPASSFSQYLSALLAAEVLVD